MMQDKLQNDCNKYLGKLRKLIDIIKEKHYENEQWALDWIDNINALSVEF